MDSTANHPKTVGFREAESQEAGRRRYGADGALGYGVDLLEEPQAPRGQPSAGTVHRVAFRVTDDEQPAWRDVLMEQGLRPTEIIDPKWFRSVYARTADGVLFEYGTKEPLSRRRGRRSARRATRPPGVAGGPPRGDRGRPPDARGGVAARSIAILKGSLSRATKARA